VVGGEGSWRSTPNVQSAPPRHSFRVCVALLACGISALRSVADADPAESQARHQH
jgi:hypothetical protein